MSQDEELLFESLRLELRRGSLILAVLASLRREQYGYSLRVALGEAGVEMEESTLYPLLRNAGISAKTAVATIGTSAMLGEVNWAAVASASALAAVLSLLTSLAGIPEAK